MSSTRREDLVRLVRELLAKSEKALAGELRDDTSLIRSGLLDSLALLEVAEWVAEALGGALELQRIDLRAEWDTVADVLAFIERRTRA
ncbi:MAG TPA: phosphopantetheine-binding protein [Myxococcota bacterium]|jgi:acyl carrier protein|nr:phosphopantetheine-binding protein [Myxococcota bacterium]